MYICAGFDLLTDTCNALYIQSEWNMFVCEKRKSIIWTKNKGEPIKNIKIICRQMNGSLWFVFYEMWMEHIAVWILSKLNIGICVQLIKVDVVFSTSISYTSIWTTIYFLLHSIFVVLG